MTVILPYSRVLSRQLPIRSGLLTRLISTDSSARVSHHQHGSKPPTLSSLGRRTSRSYATATVTVTVPKTAAKPKAHTGRTTARKTTATKTKAPAKKAPAKKTKAKPKKKVVKKAKAKPKPKPKPAPKRKPLSASAVKKAAIVKQAALKEKALLRQEPKLLPANAWTVFNSQQTKGTKSLASVATKQNGAAFRALSPAEREALNHTANQNKESNEQAYKRWVQSHTPLQVKEANTVRSSFLRDAKASKVKHLAPFRPIRDERSVKHPTNPQALFLKDRYASGDYKGMTLGEAAKLIQREFNELPASQKKTYQDRTTADKNRYIAEYKTVYGIEPPAVRPRAPRRAVAA